MKPQTGSEVTADVEAERHVCASILRKPEMRELAALVESEFLHEDTRAMWMAITAAQPAAEPPAVILAGLSLGLQGLVNKETVEELLNNTTVCTQRVFGVHVGRVRDTAAMKRLQLVLRDADAQIQEGRIPSFSEWAAKLTHDVTSAAESPTTAAWVTIGDAGKKALTTWLQNQSRSESSVRPTGLKALERLFPGYEPGKLYIVAARPGHGKTAFLLHCARAIATAQNVSAPLHVGIFSLEMGDDELAGRQLSELADIDGNEMRMGRFGARAADAIAAANTLKSMRVHIDDASSGRPTIQMICARARRLKIEVERRGGKLGLIAVDYLQLVKLNPKERHDISVGEISTEAKALSKELSVPVMLLSQLNRQCETRDDKRPIIADIRDSGQIEQDADAIFFLYRGSLYDGGAKNDDEVEIIIAKQRSGPVGRAKVGFRGDRTKFYDMQEDS